MISNYKIKFNLIFHCIGGLFYLYGIDLENISRKPMKKNLNCHIVHPHVTSTYEKVQFNESRSAAYTLYVIDHQHCSRNLVLTWEDSLQLHHL